MTVAEYPRCGSCRWFDIEAFGEVEKGIGKCQHPGSGYFKLCDRTLACQLREQRKGDALHEGF